RPQLAGLVVARAGGLAEPGLGARQLAAEHVAEDARAVGLPRLLATEHGPEQAAEIARAGEVGLQRAEQGLCALRLAGIPAQCAEQQRQGRAHRARGLRLAHAELLRDLLQRRAAELAEELVGEGFGHGDPPGRRGWVATAATGAATVARRPRARTQVRRDRKSVA